MTGGTLGLGGTYRDYGAVQTDNATSLELNANTSITRSAPLEIGGLDLNAFALPLGSAATDLTIHSTLSVDNSSSQLITNAADLILPYLCSSRPGPSLPQLEHSLLLRVEL